MPAVLHADLTGYAASDWGAIDYGMWQSHKMRGQFRGPEPEKLEPNGYVVTLGAAQTFGRFCSRPFSMIMGDAISLPVVNLGRAGAGPRSYLTPGILDVISNAAVVIVQVMSGRSLSNSVFECPHAGGLLRRRDKGPDAPAQFALNAWANWMAELTEKLGDNRQARIARINSLVEESRTIYIGEMALLRQAIKTKCILFWFSKREPDYTLQYGLAELVFGDFPQLIDGRVLDAIAPLFEDYVEVVTSRGSPQALFNRFDGTPYLHDASFKLPYHNAYYPSPEMHDDAAASLLPVVRRVLGSRRPCYEISVNHPTVPTS